MKLEPLLSNVPVLQTIGTLKREISKVVLDSRQVELRSLFVAMKGTQVDGHRYIDQAVSQGASVIVCQEFPVRLKDKVTYIRVENSAEAIGLIAHHYHGEPSEKLHLIGVTGTNGKTTIATLLHQLFDGLGYKAGLLSTVENRIGDKVIPATHTTPDAIAINALLQQMVKAGCDYAFMEVSSHAVHQKRINGLVFKGGIYTNISHDHLDYHKTFKEYIRVKKSFFDSLLQTAFALVNADDANGMVMVQNTRAKISTYGLRKMVDFKGKILDNSLDGLQLTINNNNKELFCRLVGTFNAYNLLAVYGTGRLLEFSSNDLLVPISNLYPAEGRFDKIVKNGKMGIVDYAHTPDALENVLNTLRKVVKKNQRIITIVGCGGDRDKAKRPVMSRVACNKSDLVILTSDNPRSENPDAILKEMEQGIPEGGKHKVLVITDRKQAIKTGCRLVNSGDIILVAGKGHEKYQEIKGKKYPFDDKQTLINELY